MRTSAILLVLAAGILIGSPAAAQESMSVFATYYRCDQARERDLDPVIVGAFARVLDPLVEAGRITSWGWRPHVVGTAWRRLATFTAPDRTALLEVRADIIEQVQAEQGAFAMLNDICGSHDDYIWNRVASSEAPVGESPDPGGPGLSTYYTCNQAREARADEIYTELIGPAIEAHVTMGHLAGWGWWAHDVGGEFRRIGTIAGADHATILNLREQVVAGLVEDHPDEMEEFLTICPSHEDYLWGASMTG